MNQDPWTPIRAVPAQSSLPSTNFQTDSQLYGNPYEEEDQGILGESSLYDYWLVVYKYRILIVASTIAATLLATLYAFLVTPLYTATSKIRIGTYEPILAATSVEGIYQEQTKEANYLGTQIEQITSFTVGDRVLRDDNIRQALDAPQSESFWGMLFGGEQQSSIPEVRTDEGLVYEHDVGLIKGYLGMVGVSPVRRTSLVEISATSPSASLSSRIANVHAREYREWLRESHVQQRSDTLQFLREQADELRQKVSSLERELADYAEKHSIVAVNKDENITAQRMSQLSTLLTEVTAKRIEAENVFEKAKDLNTENSAGYDDSTALQMRSELGKLQAEYGMLIEKFTPEYPKVKQLKAQMDRLEQGVREQREQIISGLRSKAIALQLEEDRLRDELEQQKSKTFELAKKQVQYNVLLRELESSRELLQNVLRQSKESALAIEGNPSNVSIVDYAVVPRVPSYPKKSLLLMAGFCIGIGLGIGIAFLLNHLDNTIRSPELLTQVTGLPNLGLVPSFESEQLALGAPVPSSKKPHGGDPKVGGDGDNLPSLSEGALSPLQGGVPHPITFLAAPKSLASEAYRTIRTGILLSQAGEPPRSILVTSSHSSEGKTTSAMNLAASLSSSGGRVVVIDCDLRRPSLMRYFDLEPGLPGLVEVITGSRELDSVKIDNLIKRITIIPAGSIPPNPAELIGSLEMKRILEQLREQYDFVIIDSPPILPVTDSVVLSRYVDGAVLVVKGGATPRRLVRDAVGRLKAVGTRVLGTILNDVDFQGADYHYYNRYYTSYYKRDEEEAAARKKSRDESSGERRAAS
ncbi:MAG: polysaccharide biosynthesis tyrosine autokinase [Bdellovibrionales bacterium]|nr:polysaccharide biosynthesis tyrosine autokinase [Bdellovibrionales bacterium]